MKTCIVLFGLLILSAGVSFSTTHVITNSGLTFTPDNITITLGDTVDFVVESIHKPREVSKATWDANGSTSNGGFDLPFGGGIVVLQQVGTHYYVCVPHAAFGMKGIINVNSTTGVKDADRSVPSIYSLQQNHPNPFNPSTMISFGIPRSGLVSLKVYNLIGEEVQNLLEGERNAGTYEVVWDASKFPSGIYFYQLRVGQEFVATKKLALMK